MELFKKINIIRKVVFSEIRAIQFSTRKEYQFDFYAAELIRNTHSIEKGLSIDNPRLGFGHEHQKMMLQYIQLLSNSRETYHVEAVKMAFATLTHYVDFHQNLNYTDEFIEKMKSVLDELNFDFAIPKDRLYGGTLTYEMGRDQFDEARIVKFINSRHSIRDFEETDVDDSKLKRALLLAQRAPSACNRQAYRAYILSKRRSKEYASTLAGIGGFQESVNRFILITGKQSAYRKDEIYQFIVSASMYASFLTLTLHLYGIGSCVIQRPLTWNRVWEQQKRRFGIPKDEQLICALAIGNIKEKALVPVSYRMNHDTMFRFIQ